MQPVLVSSGLHCGVGGKAWAPLPKLPPSFAGFWCRRDTPSLSLSSLWCQTQELLSAGPQIVRVWGFFGRRVYHSFVRCIPVQAGDWHQPIKWSVIWMFICKIKVPQFLRYDQKSFSSVPWPAFRNTECNEQGSLMLFWSFPLPQTDHCLYNIIYILPLHMEKKNAFLVVITQCCIVDLSSHCSKWTNYYNLQKWNRWGNGKVSGTPRHKCQPDMGEQLWQKTSLLASNEG